MTVHVALLRAINVGGHTQAAMADLRKLLADLGFAGVRSLLNSGNLIFEDAGQTGAELEQLLEVETAARLGVRTEYFVRDAEDLSTVIAHNPFPEAAERDPSHLVVMFLKEAPAATQVEALREASKGPEVIDAVGRHAYIVYPAGIGRSKLTNAVIEKRLGCPGTGRNWHTVLKLAELSRT